MHAIDNNNEEQELHRLREALAQSESEREALIAKANALAGELKNIRIERDLLKERLNAAVRRLFAAKSEARGAEQKDLFFNEAESLAGAIPVACEEAAAEATIEVPAHRRAKRGRKPLDAALPREVIRHELPEAERMCPHDGERLIEIGVDASEQLDIVPAQIKVLRHERVKYACPCCDRGLRLAAAPAKLIPKGLLAHSALAWVIQAKYQDALPLYRQATILESLRRRHLPQHPGRSRGARRPRSAADRKSAPRRASRGRSYPRRRDGAAGAQGTRPARPAQELPLGADERRGPRFGTAGAAVHLRTQPQC
jgi:transposase